MIFDKRMTDGYFLRYTLTLSLYNPPTYIKYIVYLTILYGFYNSIVFIMLQ